MSGGVPPSTRTDSWASNSPEPSCVTLMPVQSVNGRKDSLSRSESASRIGEYSVTSVSG